MNDFDRVERRKVTTICQGCEAIGLMREIHSSLIGNIQSPDKPGLIEQVRQLTAFKNSIAGTTKFLITTIVFNIAAIVSAIVVIFNHIK